MGVDLEKRKLSMFEELVGYEKSQVRAGGLLIKNNTVR
jgi:hypothetical protein